MPASSKAPASNTPAAGSASSPRDVAASSGRSTKRSLIDNFSAAPVPASLAPSRTSKRASANASLPPFRASKRTPTDGTSSRAPADGAAPYASPVSVSDGTGDVIMYRASEELAREGAAERTRRASEEYAARSAAYGAMRASTLFAPLSSASLSTDGSRHHRHGSHPASTRRDTPAPSHSFGPSRHASPHPSHRYRSPSSSSYRHDAYERYSLPPVSHHRDDRSPFCGLLPPPPPRSLAAPSLTLARATLRAVHRCGGVERGRGREGEVARGTERRRRERREGRQGGRKRRRGGVLERVESEGLRTKGAKGAMHPTRAYHNEQQGERGKQSETAKREQARDIRFRGGVEKRRGPKVGFLQEKGRRTDEHRASSPTSRPRTESDITRCA